jgi:hypothetical protein
MCGLSPRAVYRAIERGELVASRLCSRLRIRPEDVADWITGNRVTPAMASVSKLSSARAGACGACGGATSRAGRARA